ncbi:MAG: DUF4884 domain-containing protein [Bacteroidetes bacterium]|nr:MAG: DUF4884 domain-containing protein [Bacteroidota bacterium]
MKTITLLAFIFVSVLILQSCSSIKMPVSSHIPENNQNYVVDFLFEHDGCKVYRFYDRGNYVYFTNCCGEVNSVVNDSTIISTFGKANR